MRAMKGICYDCGTAVKGKALRCTSCIGERLRLYRHSRKEAQREINKAYYEAHGDSIRAHKRARYAALREKGA